jgi:hypothetical protein
MIEYREIDEHAMVEIIVHGRLTEEDFDIIARSLERFIRKHKKIKVLEIIEDYKGFDMPVMFKGIKFDFRYMKNYASCAVVTNVGWIRTLTNMLSPFFPVDLKTYRVNEVEKARHWLKSKSCDHNNNILCQ